MEKPMRKNKTFKKDKSTKFSIAFICSVVFHLLILAYFTVNPQKDFPKFTHQIPSGKPIDLTKVKFISPNELKQIKADQRSRQIVANELNGKKERPNDSRFAGEKDQTFDRQTMAKINGAFKEAGKGKVAESKPILEQKRTKPAKISMSELGTFSINQPESKPVEQVLASKNGIENGKEGVEGPSANNDFVEDVALGDMTNLNTTEYKYYGFYHRIRQKLEQHWGNSIQEKAKKLYKVGRRLPASGNMITAITVVLNDHGSIIDIKVEGTSGIRELDQAAIESFNKAGPFPNPPKGLLVGGRATIQWGFVVKS
jgi:protein TonB